MYSFLDPTVVTGLYKEKEFLHRLYLAFYSRDFPHTSHLAFPTHSLQAMEVYFQPVNTEGHFTRRNIYF